MGTATPLSPRAKTLAVSTVRHLEEKVFDGDGHLRHGVSRRAAESLIEQLNELRDALGWLPVDTDGRWRWPC